MSRLQRGWLRARRRPVAVVGAVVVLLFTALALGAPWIAPSDPLRTDWSQIRKAATWAHPFGTDDLGRDVFAGVVHGAWMSLQVGMAASACALAIGMFVGMSACVV